MRFFWVIPEKWRNRPQRAMGLFVLGCLTLLTLLAYFSSRYGRFLYLELASHFQVQYFALSVIGLAILGRLFRPRLFWIGLFLCALLALPIVSWYFPPRRLFVAKQPAADLHLFIANLHPKNTHYDRVVDLVRAEKPDLAIWEQVTFED